MGMVNEIKGYQYYCTNKTVNENDYRHLQNSFLINMERT